MRQPIKLIGRKKVDRQEFAPVTVDRKKSDIRLSAGEAVSIVNMLQSEEGDLESISGYRELVKIDSILKISSVSGTFLAGESVDDGAGHTAEIVFVNATIMFLKGDTLNSSGTVTNGTATATIGASRLVLPCSRVQPINDDNVIFFFNDGTDSYVTLYSGTVSLIETITSSTQAFDSLLVGDYVFYCNGSKIRCYHKNYYFLKTTGKSGAFLSDTTLTGVTSGDVGTIISTFDGGDIMLLDLADPTEDFTNGESQYLCLLQVLLSLLECSRGILRAM